MYSDKFINKLCESENPHTENKSELDIDKVVEVISTKINNNLENRLKEIEKRLTETKETSETNKTPETNESEEN